MSGDVQPRKRKDKRKKKDDEEFSHHHGSIGGAEEIIHIHKDNKLGGNICSKIVFFGLLGALGIMIGLILIEYHGISDVDTHSALSSPWSVILEDWVDNSPGDDHNDHDSNIQEEEDHDEYKYHDEEDDEYTIENSSEDLIEENEKLCSSNNIYKVASNNERDEEEIEERDLEDEEEEEIEEKDEREEAEVDNAKSYFEESEEKEHEKEEENEVEEEDESEEEEIVEDFKDEKGGEKNKKEIFKREPTYINTDIDSEEDTVENYKKYFQEGDGLTRNYENNYDKKIKLSKELFKNKKRTIDWFESKHRKMYIHEIMKKFKKVKETTKSKPVFKLHKTEMMQEEFEDVEESLDGAHTEQFFTIEREENIIDEENLKAQGIEDDSGDRDEDETSGDEDLKSATDHEQENADIPPSFVKRRQTLIPAEIMEDIQADTHPQEDNCSECEYADEVEDVEDMAFAKQTYEELGATYNNSFTDQSDVEFTEDSRNIQADGSGSPESEPDSTESEEEDNEDNLEDDPLGRWKSISGPEILAEEVEDVQDETEELAHEELRISGPKLIEVENEVYDNADITNKADWEIKEELDEADRDLDERHPTIALSKFSTLLTIFPQSARALYGKASALDSLADSQRSNALLVKAINAYSDALEAPNLPDMLLLRLASRAIDRMRFKGLHMHAVSVHKILMERFPNNITCQLELAITYLMINRLDLARHVLEAAEKKWPTDSLCRGYLGLTIKLQGYHELAIPHLIASVESDDPKTVNSHFYFHLGDALQRKLENSKANEIYKKGVSKGIFRSQYQRSLYNVHRLKAQPWWTLEETTYGSFFKSLESNWGAIRSEGLLAYEGRQGYLDESESLRDFGDWKQYELFVRGKKHEENCKRTPFTCHLIDKMDAAKSCRRGQVKFSVMEGGTHVWPHCGPTNCRLRAHLGLVIPPGTAIRVAHQTRTWEEGKVLVFDDSFEHEVWNNGTTHRLILIVDVWHPELTIAERNSLTAI